jgi:hypothetical protein
MMTFAKTPAWMRDTTLYGFVTFKSEVKNVSAIALEKEILKIRRYLDR